jgi:hypothetical protein
LTALPQQGQLKAFILMQALLLLLLLQLLLLVLHLQLAVVMYLTPLTTMVSS